MSDATLAATAIRGLPTLWRLRPAKLVLEGEKSPFASFDVSPAALVGQADLQFGIRVQNRGGRAADITEVDVKRLRLEPSTAIAWKAVDRQSVQLQPSRRSGRSIPRRRVNRAIPLPWQVPGGSEVWVELAVWLQPSENPVEGLADLKGLRLEVVVRWHELPLWKVRGGARETVLDARLAVRASDRSRLEQEWKQKRP